MTPSTLPDTLTELNDLCRFFIKAEDDLKKGLNTDIAGIEERVSSVCRTVETAMPDQQKEFLPLLTTLIDLLNGYERSLRDLHDPQRQDTHVSA